MSTPPKVNKQNWIFVTISGFVVFLLLIVLLIVYGKNLNLSTPVYFFLLLALALAATGLLAGALRSKAEYDGKAYGGSLKLGGPVVVFALIILLGYKFRPTEDNGPRVLTINVYSSKNKTPVTQGKLLIKAGAFSQREEINSKGEAVFGGIGPSISGKVLNVIAEVEGFNNPSVDSVFEVSPKGNTSIDLFLEPVENVILLRGNVIDKDNNPLINATVDIGHGLANVNTDSMGNFLVELSLKEGSEQDITVLLHGKVVYNSRRTLSSNSALSLPVQ
jgi:hypothetical protein